MVKAIVDGVCARYDFRSGKPHGLVHQVENEESKDSESQTAIVKVIAFVPCLCTRQDCRNDEAETKGEDQSKQNAGSIDMENAEGIGFLLSIAE